MSNGRQRVEQRIRELLANPPKFEGYHIRQLSDKMAEPWSTVRWYLGLMEARGEIECVKLGRARLYSLKKKAAEKR